MQTEEPLIEKTVEEIDQDYNNELEHIKRRIKIKDIVIIIEIIIIILFVVSGVAVFIWM